MCIKQIDPRLLIPNDSLGIQHVAQTCMRLRVGGVGELVELQRVIMRADFVGVIRPFRMDLIAPTDVRAGRRLEVAGFPPFQLRLSEDFINQQCAAPPLHRQLLIQRVSEEVEACHI